MAKHEADLKEIIDDLKRIKAAVSKSDSMMNFIDAGGAVRGILLAGGLLIALFSGVIYYLLEQHGSFAAIPANLRVLLFMLIGLAWAGIGYMKVRNIMVSARKISADITVSKLFGEIYTPRFLALFLPNGAVVILGMIFLSSRGHDLFIIPFLAVLFGLMTIGVSNFFFMQEVYLLGAWLIATGLLTLFMAEAIHPLAALVIIFGAGFVLTSLILYLGLTGEKR